MVNKCTNPHLFGFLIILEHEETMSLLNLYCLKKSVSYSFTSLTCFIGTRKFMVYFPILSQFQQRVFILVIFNNKQDFLVAPSRISSLLWI